jgi:hypothetical protein
MEANRVANHFEQVNVTEAGASVFCTLQDGMVIVPAHLAARSKLFSECMRATHQTEPWMRAVSTFWAPKDFLQDWLVCSYWCTDARIDVPAGSLHCPELSQLTYIFSRFTLLSLYRSVVLQAVAAHEH